MEIVRINVGGTVYQTHPEVLSRRQDSRLALELQSRENYREDLGCYFFDRRPDLFPAILAAHKDGELHIPPKACGSEFLQEIDFWKLPRTMIATCCIGKVREALDERDTAGHVERKVLANFERSVEILKASSGWRKTATRMWIFLEFPVSSGLAKAWSVTLALFVLASTIMVIMHFDTNIRESPPKNLTQHHDQITDLIDSDKWRSLWMAKLPATHLFSDLVANFPILLDYIIRFIVCPYKRQFFEPLKILDGLILMTYWISAAAYRIPFLSGGVPSTAVRWVCLVCSAVQLLRPFLILRLAGTFVGLRVMIMVVTRSISELFTIISFLGIGMIFFAISIYVFEIGVKESFATPWEGCWWAMVTMTTVGYGDTYPRGWPGYIIGILCALAGILITGLSIPILSNNFQSYYHHCEIALAKIGDRMEELRQGDLKLTPGFSHRKSTKRRAMSVYSRPVQSPRTSNSFTKQTAIL